MLKHEHGKRGRITDRHLLRGEGQPRPGKKGGIDEISGLKGKNRWTYLCQLSVVLLHQLGIDGDFSGSEGGGSDELESCVTRMTSWLNNAGNQHKDKKNSPDQLPREPEEGLFEVVVRFRRDLEVLEVLLSVESDGGGLDFPFLGDFFDNRLTNRAGARGAILHKP